MPIFEFYCTFCGKEKTITTKKISDEVVTPKCDYCHVSMYKKLPITNVINKKKGEIDK